MTCIGLYSVFDFFPLIGSSQVPLLLSSPHTKARYRFLHCRVAKASRSLTSAGRVLATTKSPPVAPSKRCTGRGFRNISGFEEAVEANDKSKSDLHKVSLSPCTVIPCGLSMTASASSS